MTDITIGSFTLQADSVHRWGIAAAALAPGDSIFITATGTIDLAEKDQTIVEAACRGVAISTAAIGQPVSYLIGGSVRMGGGTVVAGIVYCVGNAPGGIAPQVDVIATEFLTVIGIAVDTAELKLGILQSGVAHA